MQVLPQQGFAEFVCVEVAAVGGVSSVANNHAAKHRKGVSAAHPLMLILLLLEM